ncbi:MAG TPA: class I SAM-dependent methyltransferase [Chitinophagaceae bacterium]|nr:class I SAM-dependent methyltransferase [Chitinophagaceae bacterium]
MSRQTNSFYNKFSLLYPLADIFLQSHKRVLFREVNNQPCGELLEIGVGNGKHLPMYRTHKITGIDTSSSMLAKARHHKTGGIELLQMDGESLLFSDQTFDYVVLCHVIAVVGDPEALLEEAYRVLKPNGKMFVLNHFTPNTWLKYFDYSFKVVSRLLHFRSVFFINRLEKIKKFNLLKEISFGPHAYFKLLIYSRA